MAKKGTAKKASKARRTGGTRAGASRKRATKARAKGAARARPHDRVDEALVEQTMVMLQTHDRSAAASKRAIGAHVLESYFGGNESLARSKDRGKAESFARLAERAIEDTLWDERDLREAVTIEIVARTLPKQVADAIDASYLIMLGGVDDIGRRVELATRLARGELRGAAAKAAIREASGERRGGRKPQPAAVRSASELDRDGERMERDGSFEPAELRTLDPDQLARVREGLSRHRKRVEEFLRSAEAATTEARPKAEARGASDPGSS